MARLRYFDGNKGFWGVDDFNGFSPGALLQTGRLLQYAGEGLHDPTQLPFTIELVYSGLTKATSNSDNLSGVEIPTGGTLTSIIYRNDANEKIAELTGLSIDAVLADIYVRLNRGFELFQLAMSAGVTVTGSADSRGEDWNGDDISTGGGNDTVNAGGGDDFIKDQGGRDTYNGGGGFDMLSYEQSFWATSAGNRGIVGDLSKGTVRGPDGPTDTLVSIEGLRGTHTNDNLIGNGGDNWFIGLAGKDTIDGGAGRDGIGFHRDNDTDKGGGMFGVTVSLADAGSTGTARDGWGTTDRIRNIEDVEGSAMGDSLSGNSGRNWLGGRDGRDFLNGRGGADDIFGDDGNDTLIGGAGNDFMDGGEGEDVFRFLNASSGQDRIEDFDVGVDMLVLAEANRFTIGSQVSLSRHEDGTLVSFTGGTGSVVLAGVGIATVEVLDLFGFIDR